MAIEPGLRFAQKSTEYEMRKHKLERPLTSNSASNDWQISNDPNANIEFQQRVDELHKERTQRKTSANKQSALDPRTRLSLMRIRAIKPWGAKE